MKYHSNYYYVDINGILLECYVRGILKKEGVELLVGDWVTVDAIDWAAKTGRISALKPRKNMIVRPKLANVDIAIVVHSVLQPAFDYTQVDRYLCSIELAGIKPFLCITKADLVEDNSEMLTNIIELYANRLKYTVFSVSVKHPKSLEAFRRALKNQISVLSGPSGSGKSSLLNTLNPSLTLRVGEVSEKIQRGQHTTRHVELLALDDSGINTLVADTPGFSNVRFQSILPEQLKKVFKEFAPYEQTCHFSDCLHTNENGCAVLDNREHIVSSRYQSYLTFLEEARQYKVERQTTSQKQSYGSKTLDGKGKILRLKEKSREASRRTMKQQVEQESVWTQDDET